MSLNKLVQSLLLAVSVFAISAPGQAGMVGTAQLQDASAVIEHGNMPQQRNWLEQQLVLGGVDEADATLRVAAMTDAEVATVYQRIDEVPAGGSDILIVGLIVFAVLEITGYIDVIPEK